MGQKCYDSEFNGIRAYQDYRVINLWEVDVRIVFEQGLENLLPFTPIMKSGGNEATVSRALRLLRGNDRFDELEPLLTFFASYVLDEVSLPKKLVQSPAL